MLISQARGEDYMRLPSDKRTAFSVMPIPSFYWDVSFIYGYYQWEEKWEN